MDWWPGIVIFGKRYWASDFDFDFAFFFLSGGDFGICL